MDLITSRNNVKILHITSLLRDAKLRDESGFFVAEGVKLCREAVAAGVVSELFITEQCHEKNEIKFDGKVNLLKTHVYDKLTTLKSPEGVCALCRTATQAVDLKKDGRYLVLYDIQNPENAGAMIRTAAAFGFDGVIGCKGISLTSPKLLRAAVGASFVIPMLCVGEERLFPLLREGGVTTVATSPAASVGLSGCNITGGVAILIGNEGNGLPQEIITACDHAIKIEITGIESLNAAVAAGIIMYRFKETIYD